jgi:hypothetical protein
MKKLKIVCLVLGLLHAAVMTAFALGSELSPLMVLIVDAPVAHFTKDLASPVVALGIPIAVCSILYPVVIFLAGVLISRSSTPRPIQSPVPTRGNGP